MMGSTKSAAIFEGDNPVPLGRAMETDTPPEGDTVELPEELLDIIKHSSKSAPVFDESIFIDLDTDSVVIAPPNNEPDQEIIMGGSKSDLVFPPNQNNANEPPRNNANQTRPRVMPSSKSGKIFEPDNKKDQK